ncbi:MAG: polysaccharide deacetylase family protein, partial [Thermoplasmata archaeon]|nr:polysaccharide deacetylase family protein [Thermoplasmata archaeon]
MEFDIWFDDGDLSIFEIGFPLLKRHGMTATVAIVTGYVGKNYPLYRRQPCPFVNIEQLKELLEEGWEIASHSVTHRSFLELSLDEALAELVDSKRWIEENLGVTPGKFAFPMDLATSEQIELARVHYGYVRPIPPPRSIDAIFHRFTIEGGVLKYYSGIHKISPRLEKVLLPNFTQSAPATAPGENQSQIHADARWVFLTGCNNSGTTLVDYLLGLHPEIDPLKCEGHQIRSHKKLSYPENYLMPSPAVIRRPDGKRLNRVWTENLGAFKKPVVELPFLKDALMSVRASTSGTWTMEKSQLTMIRMPWTQRRFPDSRFIIIVRNGYCVAEGTRRRFNRYLGSPGWEGEEPMTVARAARHWNKAHEVMLEELEDVKDYALFRYEDLC